MTYVLITLNRLVSQSAMFANEILQVTQFRFENEVPVAPLGQIVKQGTVLKTDESSLLFS